MLRRIAVILIVVIAIFSAAGFAAVGAWPLMLPCLVLAALWLAGVVRRWEGLGSLMLFAFVVAAGIGANLDQRALWTAPMVVLALAAWDLERFAARLRLAGADADTRELERRHLWRLAGVSGLSLLLTWSVLGVRLKLGMAVALGLGMLAILGLSQLVRALVRESD
jgi:hypothetical protein